MPSQQTRPRQAPPRDPSRHLLPGILLAAAGAAFAGLAVMPASVAGIAPRVSATQALGPVELAPPEQLAAPANVQLAGALAQGLAVADPPPAPPPAFVIPPELVPAPPPPPLPREPARVTRDREPAVETRTIDGATFVRPGSGRLTSPYGRRWGRLHAGVDLAAGMGSPIRAVTDGTVLSAETESGYGQAIRLLHSDGTVTFYAHMSALLVNTGDTVNAGQQIGREGNSGRSTGPHLHFEVQINGAPVDPASWLAKRGITV